MRNSIQKQLAFVTIALLSLTIILCIFVNNTFLDQVYQEDTEHKVRQMYELLNSAGNNNKLEDEDMLENIRQYVFRNNLNVLIINANSEQVLVAAFNNGNELSRKLMGYVLGIEYDDGRQMPYDKYKPEINEVFQSIDRRTQNEYMEMYGKLDNGYWYIISVTMESMHTSVQLANRFLTYIGIGAIILGGIVSWIIARRFTKPIMDLADLSEKIMHLDFEAKYKGKDHNEIAFLGNNMNKLSDSLKKTISELKTANNELKKDLEKKEELEEMRTEFLSNVSHELKTPISLIQGYAEGLAEGITDDPESQAYYLEVIMDEASKMNQMVQKLLTLNQLEFGKNTIDLECFDLIALLNNFLQSSDILLKNNDISVSLPSMEHCYVWGDVFKVEEVVMNYFTNSVHYCKNEKKIKITLELVDKKVKVGFFNTGDPIPEESLPHLWEKFYKVDKARTREYGGSGIGLSIVKAIVTSLHQEYGVENYNNGVMFWFTLETASDEDM